MVLNIYSVCYSMVCGHHAMTYKELVYALIAKRKKYRVDTMTLSQMIGVADSSVGDWERMKKCPNGMNLLAWANALEVDIVIKDYETGRSKGFAFITFSNQEGMQAALAKDGQELDGRALRVNEARERTDKPKPRF